MLSFDDFSDNKGEVEKEEDESEEDDTTTDAERKEKMFRKRKAMAGWGSSVGSSV